MLIGLGQLIKGTEPLEGILKFIQIVEDSQLELAGQPNDSRMLGGHREPDRATLKLAKIEQEPIKLAFVFARTSLKILRRQVSTPHVVRFDHGIGLDQGIGVTFCPTS